MSERPILMTAESVRAILAGRKTETRRVIKFCEVGVSGAWHGRWKCVRPDPKGGWVFWDSDPPPPDWQELCLKTPGSGKTCPYGVPGDRLYVKEGLRKVKLAGVESFWAFYGASLTEEPGRVPLSGQASDECGAAIEWKWKKDFLSARFMPKWAARLWLEVVEVRVERVQDITEEGAKAEGVAEHCGGYMDYDLGPRVMHAVPAQYSFRTLWNRLNAKRGFGWQENPWIWVIRFKRSKA